MPALIIDEITETISYLEYCELLNQLTTVDINSFTEADFKRQLEIICNNPNHKIIVAKVNGNIIGSATILMEPKIIHGLSKVAHIEDVVVNRNNRGEGIGSLLIEHAIKIAKENGCYKIILDCSNENVGFYQKIGFSQKQVQMSYYF
jgi:glucosamine-phosphate N-acetyltransferase